MRTNHIGGALATAARQYLLSPGTMPVGEAQARIFNEVLKKMKVPQPLDARSVNLMLLARAPKHFCVTVR